MSLTVFWKFGRSQIRVRDLKARSFSTELTKKTNSKGQSIKFPRETSPLFFSVRKEIPLQKGVGKPSFLTLFRSAYKPYPQPVPLNSRLFFLPKNNYTSSSRPKTEVDDVLRTKRELLDRLSPIRHQLQGSVKGLSDLIAELFSPGFQNLEKEKKESVLRSIKRMTEGSDALHADLSQITEELIPQRSRWRR